MNLKDYNLTSPEDVSFTSIVMDKNPDTTIKETCEDEHWQDVRERAAIAAMQGFLSRTSYRTDLKTLAKDSAKLANCLVEQLKEK